jgi:hypothetical protein
MELDHVKEIKEAVQKEGTWRTQKLVIKIDENTTIDIAPYLGDGPKSDESLSFANPPLLTQKELIGVFKIEASTQGVHLIQSASSTNVDSRGGRFFKLACCRYRLYHATAATNKKRAEYQTSSPVPLYQSGVKMGTIRYSKISRGKEGKKMVRKTETTKALNNQKRCPFHFTFKYKKEMDSWFLKGGTGCAKHGFHASKTKACLGRTTGELVTEELEEISQFATASGNPRITRKIMKFKSGIELTRQQIHYIKRKVNGDELEGPGSSADKLLTYLRSRSDISFYCVYDQFRTDLISTRNKGRPTTKEEAHKRKEHELVEMVRLSDLYKKGKEDTATTNKEVHSLLTGVKDKNSIFLDALDVREALRVEDGERVLLAVAWVCDAECRLFRLFPEVTFWDSAQKTNREKRPLFLACAKDSENRSFTYLRAFMPSECQWVFEWLYTKAMPVLLGHESLKKTKLSLTDGDKNEYGPLERQIVAGTFASSQHGLCGFHLIDRSMVSNPFGKPAASKEEAFLAIKRHLKAWTISWMSSVESREEFETSKALLFAWLDSWEVLDVTGKDIAGNIKEWLVKHVLLYVEKTLLYPRLHLRAFHEYVNSVAEIEVSAMKNGNDVMPYMRIGSSAKKIQEKNNVRNNYKEATAL